jgi:non-ribosomal peptide synthetase component E (peptide arylation enzyme)
LEQRFSAEDESLRPVEYSKVDVFPLTSIGKIDYKKLEEISKRI